MLAKEPGKRPESMDEVLEGMKAGKVFRSTATAAKKAT
jgi:hypothetical protein